MGGNYIQTGFTNPTNSILGADGKFIVGNPFATLAAARLTNTLRGLGMSDIQIGNHLIKQRLMGMGRWPGARLGDDGSGDYPIDGGGDPTLDPCYVDPTSCGATDTATPPTYGPPQNILDILNQPVDTTTVEPIDPLTDEPYTALPGNWIFDPSTGTYVPGPGGAIGTSPGELGYGVNMPSGFPTGSGPSSGTGSGIGTGSGGGAGKSTGATGATPSCPAGYQMVQTAQGTSCVNQYGQQTAPTVSSGLGISSSTLTTLALVVGAGALLIFAMD